MNIWNKGDNQLFEKCMKSNITKKRENQIYMKKQKTIIYKIA